MVTIDDVAGVVKARFAAVAAFATAVPGGAWLGRGPDTPDAYPYEVHQIEAERPELFGGSIFIQKFLVRSAIYAPVGASGVDPQAVQQATNTALCSDAANTAVQAASLRNATDLVLHARPAAVKGEFAPTLREGRDVFVCGTTAEILVQSDKSVA